MIVLGGLLCIIFNALVKAVPGMALPAAAYVILLTQTSMEGFFATIVPTYIRVGVVLLLVTGATILLIRFQKMATNRWQANGKQE
jgi:protein-S-isoprenylcysteine O-methyltransferase Ste14